MTIAFALSGCSSTEVFKNGSGAIGESPTDQSVFALTEAVAPTTPPLSLTPPTPTPSAEPKSWERVFDDTSSGVVLIDVETCGYPYGGGGAGFLIGDHHVLTAAHVVEAEGVTPNLINLVAGNQHATAQIVGFNRNADLALLRTSVPLDGHNFSAAIGGPDVGSPLAVMGYPLEVGQERSPDNTVAPRLVEGTVSAINKEISYHDVEYIKDVMQTNVSTEDGDSGGPVVNAGGELIGIHVAADGDEINTGMQRSGYAVQVSRIQEALVEWVTRPAELPLQDCRDFEADWRVPPAIYAVHDQASNIGQSFREHGEAITRGDLDTAFTIFSDQMFGTDPGDSDRWSEGLESSRWSNLSIDDVEPSQGDGKLLKATVSFTSTQDADAGPAGLQDPTCARWEFEYGMSWEPKAARWLVDSQKKSDSYPRDCWDEAMG